MKTFELSLSPEYVHTWTLWEAIRELLQNVQDNPAETIFTFDEGQEIPDQGDLRIGNKDTTIAPRTLLLGVSTKRNDENLIGEFGEGYKLSLLVLTRLGYPVTILNGPLLWKPRFADSEKFGEKILMIDEYPGDSDNKDFVVIVHGLDKSELQMIQQNYLPGDHSTRILLDNEQKGRIFVGGLFVKQIDKLTYGYNFSPVVLKLGRDRNMVSDFDVSWQTSLLWAESTRVQDIFELLMSEAFDIDNISHFTIRRADDIKERFEETFGERTIPCHFDAEYKQALQHGHPARRVGNEMNKIIRALKPIRFPREKNSFELLNEFIEKWGTRPDTQVVKWSDLRIILDKIRHLQ